jgi:hypothetical protein
MLVDNDDALAVVPSSGRSQQRGAVAGAAGGRTIKRHIIQASTYQMCVLMLFNKRPTWTYEVRKI